MVTRITDTGILPTAPVQQGRANLSAASADSAPGTAAAPDSKSPSEPAVKINLSTSASQQAAVAVSSEALVEEIRQRLASGQFQIDYEKVGEGMLRELIAQSARKARP